MKWCEWCGIRARAGKAETCLVCSVKAELLLEWAKAVIASDDAVQVAKHKKERGAA